YVVSVSSAAPRESCAASLHAALPIYGREALSELFDYRVELLSEDDGIGLEDILGTPLQLEMTLQSGATRYFHGHVVQFAYAGTRSEEHTSELQSRENLVCRLLLEKKK